GRPDRLILREGSEVARIPCLAQDVRQRVALPVHRLQGAAQLRLDDQETLVEDAGVEDLILARGPLALRISLPPPDLVPHVEDEPFARYKAALDPLVSPVVIDGL